MGGRGSGRPYRLVHGEPSDGPPYGDAVRYVFPPCGDRRCARCVRWLTPAQFDACAAAFPPPPNTRPCRACGAAVPEPPHKGPGRPSQRAYCGARCRRQAENRRMATRHDAAPRFALPPGLHLTTLDVVAACAGLIVPADNRNGKVPPAPRPRDIYVGTARKVKH